MTTNTTDMTFEEFCKQLNLREETVSGFGEIAFAKNYIAKREQEVRKEVTDDLRRKVEGYFEDETWMEMRKSDLLSWLEEASNNPEVENIHVAHSEYRCGEDRRPRWITTDVRTGEIISDEKYTHQDENYSNMCSSQYCRCTQ
jgi:hypothetical protein